MDIGKQSMLQTAAARSGETSKRTTQPPRVAVSARRARGCALAAPRPSQSVAPPESTIALMLRREAGGMVTVPPGWLQVLRHALRDLTSACREVPHRHSRATHVAAVMAAVGKSSRFVADPVVEGIYRKALARARNTCQLCGRHGRAGDGDKDAGIYCPRCAEKHGRRPEPHR